MSEPVPHVVHQVWLGGELLPPILGGLVDGVKWKVWESDWYGPQWSYRLWDEGHLLDERGVGERFAKLAGRCCHRSQISNVARYLLLEIYGGLYIDTDVELFRLPSDLSGAWIAGTSETPDHVQVNPCCLAAPPGHPYIVRMLAAIEAGEVDLSRHMSAGPDLAIKAIGPDVNIWPGRVWHGRRGQREALGHHYGWGPKLKSFLRCHGLPPTNDIDNAK